jgi:hypothetical protein
MSYMQSLGPKTVDIMAHSSYTFLEAVAQKQHYEKPTLRDLGCTPVGSLDVPHRSSDGSASRGALKPTA